VHLFNSCFFLARVPDGNDHSRAFCLEVPLFAEKLPAFGGAKRNTKNQKRFSMVDSRWTMPRKAHLPRHSVVAYPSPRALWPITGRSLQKESSSGQEIPGCVPGPGETCCQVQQVLQPARPRQQHGPSCQSQDELGGQEGGYTWIHIGIKTVLVS